MRLGALVCLLITCAGCSSSSFANSSGGDASGGLTVSGNLGGSAATFSSAIFTTLTAANADPKDNPDSYGLYISFSTRSDFCSNLGDGDSSELDLFLPTASSYVGTTTFSANTASGAASGTYGIYGDSTVTQFNLTSGTISISSSSSDGVAGTFDLTFGNGDSESGGQSLPGGEIKGTFNASSCPGFRD